MKIHNYFSIYTVRTGELEDFCQAAELEYQQLLKHCKTRWLSLFPSIARILEIYPALKDYFLSQEKAPKILTDFFKNKFSEAYLWFLHSLISIFQEKIEAVQQEMASITEIRSYIKSLEKTLQDRLNGSFIPLSVKTELRKIREKGFHEECDQFSQEILALYSSCLEYLRKWTAPLAEFQCFEWLNLTEDSANMSFEDLQESLVYLQEREVVIDDLKLFDQIQCLKEFIAHQSENKDFFKQLLHMRWVKFFTSVENIQCFSELLVICQFFFALPSNNCNVERVFSDINVQWSDEKNKLGVESVKGIILTKYNFKDMCCSEFYKYVMNKPALLRKISSSEKYN